MTRTPDETKKGLECCAVSYADCNNECPYKRDCDGSQILKDALALIKQLEAERDAAVKDVELFPDCSTCKYDPRKKGYIPNDCDDCVEHCNYKWRGVQKEE